MIRDFRTSLKISKFYRIIWFKSCYQNHQCSMYPMEPSIFINLHFFATIHCGIFHLRIRQHVWNKAKRQRREQHSQTSSYILMLCTERTTSSLLCSQNKRNSHISPLLKVSALLLLFTLWVCLCACNFQHCFPCLLCTLRNSLCGALNSCVGLWFHESNGLFHKHVWHFANVWTLKSTFHKYLP